MREPSFRTVEHIGLWDWGGSGPLTLLFCHATGFHGRCWDESIRRLPPQYRVIAMDMRGHGRSGNPEGPLLWKNHGHDAVMVLEALRIEEVFAVGHSMGGHAITYAAALQPAAFRGLLLLDPVIRPRDAYGTRWVESHFARKRRNRFASADEMYGRFKDRPPFNTWDPQVLRDYCNYGLRGSELACAPDTEGATYENSTALASDISDEIGSIAAPVWVLRSHVDLDLTRVDMNGSPCDPGLAARFQRGHDITVPFGHFFPMEEPSLVSDRIQTCLSTFLPPLT